MIYGVGQEYKHISMRKKAYVSGRDDQGAAISLTDTWETIRKLVRLPPRGPLSLAFPVMLYKGARYGWIL